MDMIRTVVNREIRIRCAKCGTESVRTPESLRAQPIFVCPTCGTTFDCAKVLTEASSVRGRAGLLGRLLGNSHIKFGFKIERD